MSRLLCRIALRRRPLRRETGGSVHILETMIVAIMVVGAVVAVSTMNAPVSNTEGFKSSQEQLVQDALDNMAAQPSRDNSEVIFDTLLEEYVMKAVAGQKGPLMGYLNRTLPPGAQYNVFLDTGFGSPLPVVEGGSPPGESMTGARSFVPKMSYVFMVPEFQRYQEDFHMNVLAIPMHNSILQKDEGEAVELAVTFTNPESGDEVTQRAFSETALRFNDPDNRSWASTSIYASNGGSPSYYIDASNTPLYGLDSGLDLFGINLDEAYNISVPLVVEESAGHPIQRGAQISVEFARGWEFSDNLQQWVEDSAEEWTDFEWEGSAGEGWTISARLADPLKSGQVPFNITGEYVMLVDTSYPYFQPVVAWMGGGTQGKSTILLGTPQALDAGGFRRDLSLSLAKPMISGENSTWGMNLGNMGDEIGGDIDIKKIEVRQPQGIPIMGGVVHLGGWASGEWNEAEPGHYTWTPDGGSASVPAGDAAWLSMKVEGGPTRDNHYRNHDYQDISFHYSTDYTPQGGQDNWTFEQRAHHMGAEYVYRQLVPPLEEETWPGWPDQESDYWFRAHSKQQNREAVGNSSYEVRTSELLTQTFGDYQGSHVFSRIHLEDPEGERERQFELGERVHIKNDFSALFGQLAALDASLDLDAKVDNIEIESSVFTPEKAWTGVPTKTFKEDAGVDVTTGSFMWLMAQDLTENGILDVVAVDSAGLVYALDGRDGSKLWQLTTKKEVHDAVLSDVTADGDMELVLGTAEDRLYAYDLDLYAAEEDRLLAGPLNVSPSGLNLGDLFVDLSGMEITAMLDLSQEDGSLGDHVLAVAVSSKVAGGYVVLVKTDDDGELVKGKVIESTNPNDSNTVIDSLARMEYDSGSGGTDEYLAVASMNQTVSVYSLPDLKLHWITNLPQRALHLSVADLTGDGWDDVVVNTAKLHEEENDASVGGGDEVFVLPGRTGHFGPGMRTTDPLSVTEIPAREAGITSDGWTAAVADGKEVMQDHSGFYSPILGMPSLGACDYDGSGDPLDIGTVWWDPTTITQWLEERQWSGVHVAQGESGDELYIVARQGPVMRAVDECPDNSLKWETVEMASPNSDSLIDLHAYKPDDDDGSLYRMDEEGLIEVRTGVGQWSVVADACEIPELSPCEDKVSVNRWDVEEDADGRPVRFWATLEREDPVDDSVSHAHVVSVDVDDLADPEGDPSDAVWVEHYTSTDRDVHALYAGPAGAVYFGGGASDGSLFMMQRDSDASAFEEQEMFYANSTKEHGGLLLDIKADGDHAWALDEEWNVWRRAAADSWVPYASWAEEGGSGALATDPRGTTWAFMDDLEHMPLRTHAAQAEVRLPDIQLDSTLDAGTSVYVEIESEEAHLSQSDDADPVTNVRWYARPAGAVSGTGADHSWTGLSSSGWDKLTPLGLGDAVHKGGVPLLGASDAIEVKAVLQTRTVQDTSGNLHQDPGMSPLLHSAVVDVKESQFGETLASGSFVASQMEAGDDAIYDGLLDGFMLDDEEPRWSYLGGMNLEVQLSSVTSRHNRLVDVGDKMTSDSTGPGVVVADRSDAFLNWYVLDAATGLPERPVSGPVGVSGSDNMLFDLLVGDLTGDGIDNVALMGDFASNGDGPEYDADRFPADPDALYQGMIWDTERDAWRFVESDENQIIPAAILTGPQQGRQTLTFSVPTASFYLFLEDLGYESEKPNFITSFFGPRYDASFDDYEPPEMRWGTNPLEAQGHTTFSYKIPNNALFGTSIVMSELTFDVAVDGGTPVTQTARLLDWFDILPPGRSKSVPPVYTVEVVAWYDEGYGQVDQRSGSTGGGSGGGGGGGGLDVVPDEQLNTVN